MKYFALLLPLLLASFPAEAQVEPPFSGTVWITPNILGPSDPTSFDTLTYSGRGSRDVFDRRVNRWITVNAYLFDAKFGTREVEFQQRDKLVVPLPNHCRFTEEVTPPNRSSQKVSSV